MTELLQPLLVHDEPVSRDVELELMMLVGLVPRDDPTAAVLILLGGVVIRVADGKLERDDDLAGLFLLLDGLGC